MRWPAALAVLLLAGILLACGGRDAVAPGDGDSGTMTVAPPPLAPPPVAQPPAVSSPSAPLVVRCTAAGADVGTTAIPVDPSGIVDVRIENEADVAVSIRLGDGAAGGLVVAPHTAIADSWDVSPGTTPTLVCLDGVTPLGVPARVSFTAAPGYSVSSAPCQGAAWSLAPDAPVVPLDGVEARVRAIIVGLRPTDVIRAPASTGGASARWTVVRDGKVVGSVEFASVSGGWVASAADACGDLTVHP